MPDYSYTASDLEGHVVSGVVSADDEVAARRLISEMGFQRPRLVRGQLSVDEADELALTVADAINADLPLASALEAAAMESDQSRLRSALQRLAKIVNDGNSLDAALVRMDDAIPPPIAALLSASAASGAIAHVLPEIIEYRKSIRMIWTEMWLMVSYPLIVLYCSMLLFSLFGIVIVAPFKEMFDEFSLQIPVATLMVIWWHDVGAWCLLGFLIFFTAAMFFGRVVASPARRRRLLAWAPIVGPIVHWTSVSEMSGTLALMIDSGMPLPDAVRYTGMSSDDVDMQVACREIEQEVLAGVELSEAMHKVQELPPTIIPMVQWGEREGSIPEALRSYAAAVEQRVRNRGHLVRLIVPLLVLVCVGLFLSFAIIALFMPLIDLIQGLT